jgi:hypothetical protein
MWWCAVFFPTFFLAKNHHKATYTMFSDNEIFCRKFPSFKKNNSPKRNRKLFFWRRVSPHLCNQKERVRKYIAQRLLSTNPGVHAHLNHSTQLRPPKMYNSLIACWIITRLETCKSFTPTQQQNGFHNMCPLPHPFTQSSTKGEHSHCIAGLCTFRKHKLSFSPIFTETRAS